MASSVDTTDKVLTQEPAPTPAPEPATQGMQREGEEGDIESDAERERKEKLLRKAMQLSDEISELYEIANLKEKELAHIKQELGVTFLDELKVSMGSSFKSVSDKWLEMKSSDAYKKTEDTLYGWKDKVTQSDSYKKTVTTISTTGEKATLGLQTATSRTGEAFKRAGESFIENETVQAAWARMVNFKDSLINPVDEPPNTDVSGARPEKEDLVPDENTKPENK
ncbi:Tumor protein D54 isoform X5 [Oopsacas minuta]|uniref:Tumor protein D54 isoform X5 n=1 Tax=Oopsacas minuta TaxID=111878 RepID=A0AAV7J8I6_9METZ|nr:Tumor protein D54 isoform X5 [Oopsacas minuta]